MKVLITSQNNKQALVKEFSKYAEVVDHLTQDVELIVPTVDEELPFFARAKEFFNSKGIYVMVPSDYTIDMCRDKAEFYRFCKRHGFKTPVTMQESLIAKPRFGKGSKGIIRIDRSYIVQQVVDFPEISIDYFADFEGHYVSIVPRYRMHVVNGESKDFMLVKNFDSTETKRLGKELGLVGHNVIQGFYDGKDVCFTEVNCRFGGGSHFSWRLFSGPKWLINYCERFKCTNAPVADATLNASSASKEIKKQKSHS
jgi:carbamoyl-phosphate synthase large subunit